MKLTDWIYPVLAFGLIAGILVVLFGCGLTDPTPEREPVKCWPVEYCGDTTGGMVSGGAK